MTLLQGHSLRVYPESFLVSAIGFVPNKMSRKSNGRAIFSNFIANHNFLNKNILQHLSYFREFVMTYHEKRFIADICYVILPKLCMLYILYVCNLLYLKIMVIKYVKISLQSFILDIFVRVRWNNVDCRWNEINSSNGLEMIWLRKILEFQDLCVIISLKLFIADICYRNKIFGIYRNILYFWHFPKSWLAMKCVKIFLQLFFIDIFEIPKWNQRVSH